MITEKGCSIGTAPICENRKLPSEMGESLVGFCHSVGIFLLLECSTSIGICIQKLCRKLLSHGFSTSCPSGIDDPSHGKSFSSRLPDFGRDLIGCSTDTLGFDFDDRLDILKSL